MNGFKPHFLVFQGCLWLVGVGDAAAKPKPLPALPPRKLAQHQAATVKPPVKLPPTGSRLSPKPAPKPPVKTAATGRTNPDVATVGLADQRLKDNSFAPAFSLEDALALALANNPRMDEAQAAVNAANANIGSVGSQGKFQADLNGSTEYGRNTSTSNSIAQAASSSSSSSSGGSAKAASPSRSFLRFDQLTANASQPITSGGRVKAATRQARYQAVAQIYQLAQTEQDLILETTLGYLDVLRADQLLRVTNANLAVSQERLRIAQLRYGVGASARLDVLQAQTDLADARSRCIQAVNALGSSNAALNVLLGRSPETPIRLVMISRLDLPDVAYGIKPASVLPAAQPGQTGAGQNGNSNGNNGNNNNGNNNNGNTNNGNTNNDHINGGNVNNGNTTGKAYTSTSPGASVTNALPMPTGNGATGVLSGPSAPASGGGGTATTAMGGANTAAPAKSTTPATGGSTPSTGTATAATGTTATSPSASGSASGSSMGSTANLSSGSVPANASTGLQAVAGSTRDSLAVTQAQIGAAQAAVDIAKAGKKPQLGLNLSALLRNPATFLGNFGASIGLGLAQNLFDSGRTKYQVSSAQGALDELKAHLAGQQLEVADAIETSLLTLDSAQQRQANSEAGVTSASEALRVAQIGFRSGVRTTLDLADAQAALLSTQTDAVNARFDVADAQAALAAAVGIYTIEAQNARERAIPEQQSATTQAKKQIEILQPAPKKKRRKFLGIF